MSIIETNLGAVTIKDYDNGHEVPGPSFIPPPQHLTPQVSMDSDLLLAQVNVGQSPQSFVQSPCHSFIQSPHSYIQSPPQEVVEGCEEELDDYNITSPLSMYSSISSAPSQTVSLGQEALRKNFIHLIPLTKKLINFPRHISKLKMFTLLIICLVLLGSASMKQGSVFKEVPGF